MYWNHRVVKLTEEDGYMILAEVSYADDGTPFCFSEVSLGSETMEGLRLLVSRLADALKQPVLDDTAFRDRLDIV